MPEDRDRPVVRVKPRSYQPTAAEMHEPIVFPPGTTPEDLARVLVTPVTVVEDVDRRLPPNKMPHIGSRIGGRGVSIQRRTLPR